MLDKKDHQPTLSRFKWKSLDKKVPFLLNLFLTLSLLTFSFVLYTRQKYMNQSLLRSVNAKDFFPFFMASRR
jgi:hypothetical protein